MTVAEVVAAVGVRLAGQVDDGEVCDECRRIALVVLTTVLGVTPDRLAREYLDAAVQGGHG